MLVAAGVEESLFKPTANGWIFSGPDPWLPFRGSLCSGPNHSLAPSVSSLR